MNCAEFQELLPEILDSGETSESKVHAHSCKECSELYAELREISQAALLLRGVEEPNLRVWNSIEITLRQEGLIRDAALAGPALVPGHSRNWRLAWLVPIAALLVVMTSGIAIFQRNSQPQSIANLTPISTADGGTAEDQEILRAIGERTPTLRATYAADLQNINSYIRDAQDSLKNDPGDEEAQRALMGAYEQRAMVYEMAFERPLP